jgi:hypothetical protein
MISLGRADATLRGRLLVQANAVSLVSREINKRINACSLLLSLPVEILREVASFLSTIWPPVYPHCRELTFPICFPELGWIALSHVCHSLRTMLLDYHALWAEVVCVFPEARDEVLRRAGGLPLSISIELSLSNSGCSHVHSWISFMADNLYRAKSIFVSGTSYERVLDPVALSGQTFPHLNVLDVMIPASEPHHQLVTGEAFVAPPFHSPSLRKLHMFGFYVPFDGSTLTSLKLGRAFVHSLPSPIQFLDMLRSCKNLKNLVLRDWVPSITPSSDHKPTIFFPALTKLEILTSGIESCGALWSHLAVPPSTERCFEIIVNPAEAQASVHFDLLIQLAKRDLCLPIHGISVSHWDEETADLAFSPAALVNDRKRVIGAAFSNMASKSLCTWNS